MNVFCCECGREVETVGEVFHPGGVVRPMIIGHCPKHPTAKRTRKNWVHEAFEEMRRIVDAANGVGKVFRASYGEPIQRMEIRGYVYGRANV